MFKVPLIPIVVSSGTLAPRWGAKQIPIRKGRDKIGMKFLVVAKLREIPPVPTEKSLEMVVGQWQTALQFRKEGKVEVNYALAGLKGGMSIVEVESGAELNATLSRHPFYTFLDIQIYPLMTVEEALTQAKQSLEAFKAQKPSNS